MTAAELVDGAATATVVVYGTPPPDGRDLDLIATEPAPIEAALRGAGFVQRRSEWARFDADGVEAVDLAGDWPRAAEIASEAIPLDGFDRLARPAPHHVILIAAQLLALGGRFPAKRAARARAAIAEDPAAPARARELARAWGLADQLEVVLAGAPVEPRTRPRRPRIVAFSGIDGSGKSTQARRLAETLRTLGYEVEIAWAPLGQSKVLHAIFGPVTALLGRLRALQPAPESEGETGLEPNAGSVLRDRSALAHRAWTTIQAATNGLFHARTAVRAAARGRVVIFDRYVLDSRVRLRFLYGSDRSYALQDAIVRLLSPPPLGAFFLEVAAEESLARKDDRWSRPDLERLVSLYAELDGKRVTRLDGTRPQEALAAEIAQAVWLRLD